MSKYTKMFKAIEAATGFSVVHPEPTKKAQAEESVRSEIKAIYTRAEEDAYRVEKIAKENGLLLP